MLLQLQGLLPAIGILDIVDIVLVAFFLYRIYLMLKNTRGATLIKGLLVLLIFMIVSRWLNLYVISWLLEKSMTIIMVALPIVFQPELRRALELLGRGQLFHKGSELNAQEVEEIVNAVVGAAVVMSRRKLGALMVFERETGLEERIETGVQLDALISESLLLNIFEKDTPLHDGAAIIRGKRIVAAGCLLPLTENRNLSQELGMRHRAGIGISEQSDAIIIIVSEETGTISSAKNGNIMRYLTANDLKEILRKGLLRSNVNMTGTLLGKFNDWRCEKK
ncbi:MAG: diadenylate cyclase CdaA [Phascolarctobacterium sp.]|nr:diadenylate cyclase CdaA [Phascolarctobacterium sp.]